MTITLPRTAPALDRPAAARLIACYATILACVPYITLKIAWVAGSTVGWTDAADAEGTTLRVANAITLGMDAIAIVVALAFTYRWGRRLPAWLVITPIWIGTGLLAPITLSAPVGGLIEAFNGSSGGTGSTGSADQLDGWVYMVVYGGFSLQGIGLLTAFVLYARTRWSYLFKLRIQDLPKGATHSLQTVIANAVAVMAVPYAAVQFYWAFGGTGGIAAEQVADRTASAQVVNGVWGLLAVAGAVGLLALVHRRGSGPLWRPLTAAWVGAGSLFAWSLYMLLVTLGRPDFLKGETEPLGNLVLILGLLAGLLMGLVGAFLLTERSAGRSSERQA